MKRISQLLLMIVPALTNLGQRLVLVLPLVFVLFGCTPTIYVEPANAIPFDQMVTFDATIGAQVEAHNIASLVRGDAPSKQSGSLKPMRLPEAFTSMGLEGTRAYEYHLGYAAARLIRAYYAALRPNGLRIHSQRLLDVVDEAGGNTYVVVDINEDWPIEIADIEKRQVFEVVPPGQTYQAYGKKKVDFHLMFLNQAMIGVPEFKMGTGFQGEIGVRFAEKTPPWRLSFQTIEPGVISFNWHVLTVARATDETYRQAYLQGQWHEPTPREMARLGRALHLVVEKLVQAREALGQIRAREEMPMTPGKTMREYLRALSLWSTHDDRIARLMPIMREMPPRPPAPNVRPDRRFIGETVIPQVPNEGYTTDGKPGSKPFQFHLGSSAHKIIAMHYRLQQQEQNKVAMNFTTIATIVNKAGGNDKLVLPSEALLRPDIATWGDRNKHIVFEIKPDRPNNLVEGQTIVAQYLAALNRGMVGKTPFRLGEGFHGNVGVKFADGLKRWNLTWRTASPGVILYKLRRLGVSAEDQAAAEAIKRAQDEGRWVDLTVKARLDKAYQEAYDNDQWVEMTEAEMEPYAKQLEEAVDLIVGDRELMLELQDMVNVPIEIVGRISTDILSAELYRHMSNVKPKVPSSANVPPATLPRSLPQNDNGVRSPPKPPPAPPRMTPQVYKPKKAA